MISNDRYLTDNFRESARTTEAALAASTAAAHKKAIKAIEAAFFPPHKPGELPFIMEYGEDAYAARKTAHAAALASLTTTMVLVEAINNNTVAVPMFSTD